MTPIVRLRSISQVQDKIWEILIFRGLGLNSKGEGVKPKGNNQAQMEEPILFYPQRGGMDFIASATVGDYSFSVPTAIKVVGSSGTDSQLSVVA